MNIPITPAKIQFLRNPRIDSRPLDRRNRL